MVIRSTWHYSVTMENAKNSNVMKKMALCLKVDTEDGQYCAKETVTLLKEYGCRMYISDEFRELVGDYPEVEYRESDRLFDDAECVIVFGGDGTIMRTAHKTNLPILGINLGRIGYMAELEIDELYLLKKLIEDDFTVESRMMIDFCVNKNGDCVHNYTPVLNEVVLAKGGYIAMAEIELVCNGEEVGKYFADGLICATPTGSTAYSLAAGGSIVDPGMECFCVSHICPQSFYAKPLIFGGGSVLQLKKGKYGHGRLFLSSDGECVCEIEADDVVTVKKSESCTKFIKIKKNNFYSVMNSKMTEI